MLESLLDKVRRYPGVVSKVALAPVISSFDQNNPSGFSNGDDTAVLKSGKGYDLFAVEGFLPDFVANDPWFAGWCGVMVNVSDIAAMGGRPRAVVNALWQSSDESAKQIFLGMKAASETYGVPIVGGHTSHKSDTTQLAVSILGHANQVLSSFDAKAGDAIIVAMDQRGEFRAPYLNWNATTNAPAERLRGDLELLPLLAEKGYLTGCKDISQAGLLGTLAMFMDCSQTGADIFLNDIPKPKQVKWDDWLCAFPSFGFLMTCPVDRIDDVTGLFKSRDIDAACIGHVTERPSIDVTYIDDSSTDANSIDRRLGIEQDISHLKQTAVFWDFEKNHFLGFRKSADQKESLCL